MSTTVYSTASDTSRYESTCDASALGAESAAVRFVLDGKALHFCQHHANQHGPALIAKGAEVFSLSPDIEFTKREPVSA